MSPEHRTKLSLQSVAATDSRADLESGGMDTQSIAIGELSRLSGCNIETVRYYERIPLLPCPARRGAYRRYEAEDVERLLFVRRARELGFTLDQVRALLSLAAGGRESCADVRTCGRSPGHISLTCSAKLPILK